MSDDTEKAILAELSAIKKLLADQRPADRLTREQAAASLNISTRTFDRLVEAKQINRDQLTGPIRFRAVDIENYKKTRAAVIRPRRKRAQKVATK